MDFERIAVLLDVIHKAAEAGPEYSWAAADAREELRKIRDANRVTEPPAEPAPTSTLFTKRNFAPKDD